jgi:hypothetical protein
MEERLSRKKVRMAEVELLKSKHTCAGKLIGLGMTYQLQQSWIIPF